MPSALRKLLPGRYWELALASLFVVALGAVIWLNRAIPGAVGFAVVALEQIAPLAIALVAAGLLAGDPALDLLLSVPRPAPRILAARLALVLGAGAALALSIELLCGAWGVRLPQEGAAQPLIWAAPLALYSGLATVGALLRGRMLDGVGLATGTWGLALLSLPLIAQVCAATATPECPAAIASPALTSLRPTDPLWLANRVLWLSAGVLLLGVGLLLARREERLVLASADE